MVLIFGMTACSGPMSIMDPAGPGASRVARLWWLIFWISIIVMLVVLVLLVYSLRTRRKTGANSEGNPEDVPAWGIRFVAISGFVIPVIVLIVVLGISLFDLAALGKDQNSQLRIEVTGHMWWWEARYPNGVVTANEIHIPVGEPVEFSLETADVIHSFWIPSLFPKKDMIPGRANTLTMEASKPGRYQGICSEFCGLQHANMGMYVVADVNFTEWLANQELPALKPSSNTTKSGLEVFLGSTCIGCHTIRGTAADSTIGPDLTHVADRETLFAARVDNTRANLKAIIIDPQGIKPGAAMPPTTLTDADLESLLDYLESLR
ncbi:MAG: cytochrome c oxidase subunit II [Acidimicrobiia bacterium]|nr:cytochrome c oxidase subunit II [Acidimicrobiia bacterium]